MASMAAAIHAAKVRASEKNAEKSTEKNAVKNGAQKNNADHKNASRSNRRGGGTGRARKQGNSKGNQQGGNKGNQQQNRPAPRRYEPFIPEVITYPEELPVSERRDDITNAIRDNQVVIIAGETGSGKTTQIPKMCLELGLGEKGLIGHTQPRRLAARSVAERIAEELGQKIGETVGYQVRFTSEVGEHSAIKLMTDGILLAEIQNDKLLRRYSTLIIDEAHERSLNIDFILGYLKRILPQRPDLKVIITSATIDPERFARHFSPSYVPGKGIVDENLSDEEREIAEAILPDDAPPIIEVSGRTYPVEIRYRPLEGDELYLDDEEVAEDRDPTDAILDAIKELSKEAPGDILIFFSGEREIRDAKDAIEAMVAKSPRLNYEVLPLYARLSLAEQHRVFSPGSRPRIVLATNVAETSLTVPGIKYVIDTGTARISRYSARTKVQRLPIERISQASANQRSGRCGRVSDGIAIRLYSEEDFNSRPEFTDPEILRTNLAAVILQMIAIGVVREPGDISRFPFVQPPASRAINDGVNLLRELGALTERTRRKGRGGNNSATLTAIGRAMAAFPVDPRLARMIIEGGRRGCAKEMMVLAAALTIQDPRERPADVRAEADAMHARFVERHLRFLLLPAALGLHQRAAGGAVLLAAAQDVPPRVHQLPAHPRMAGPLRPAARNGPNRQHSRQRRSRYQRLRARGRHPQEPAHRSALARGRQGRTREGLQGTQPLAPANTSAHAAPSSQSSPAPACSRRGPTGCSPPNSSKPPACGRAPTPPSNRSGSKRSASTSSACNTPNRTGPSALARPSPTPRAPSSA